MLTPDSPRSRWWMLPVGGTALLLAYNSPWMRIYFADAYRLKQWVFGLHLEMNFAVWWTAVLFLLGAGLFYEAASIQRARRRPYVELTLLLLAIVADEIGSLHERVSGFGGWPSLAPFALLMAALLGDAVRLLWRERQTRKVAWLILAGFLILASVAGQEYAEHNLTSSDWSEWWGRFLEEATELTGALVVLGGAVVARWGGGAVAAAAVVPDPRRFRWLRPIVLFGLVIHFGAAQILYLPKVGPDRWYGSPAAVYPVAVFLLLACYAFWVPRREAARTPPRGEVAGFWNLVGAFFLLCSVGYMQNLWGLVGKLIDGLAKRHFYEPVPLWVGLVLAAWVIGWSLRRDLGRRALWLLGLPLAAWIDLSLDHLADKHLAAGLFAALCALALLPGAPSPAAPEVAAADPGRDG